MQEPTRVYDAIVVHRDPRYERSLAHTKPFPTSPASRQAVAESCWRLSESRGNDLDYLFVESEGFVAYASKILAAQRIPARLTVENPQDEGRVRFLTDWNIDGFVEDLIGTEVPAGLLPIRPLRYAKLVHNLATGEARLEAIEPDQPR